MAYAAPSLTEIGTVRDLTLGDGIQGNDDTLFWFIKYGTNPTS